MADDLCEELTAHDEVHDDEDFCLTGHYAMQVDGVWVGKTGHNIDFFLDVDRVDVTMDVATVEDLASVTNIGFSVDGKLNLGTGTGAESFHEVVGTDTDTMLKIGHGWVGLGWTGGGECVRMGRWWIWWVRWD